MVRVKGVELGFGLSSLVEPESPPTGEPSMFCLTLLAP
jgi:hypothetical protein